RKAHSPNAQPVLNEFGPLSQTRRYRQLAGELSNQISADPAGFFKHRLEAALCFLLGEEWLEHRVLWQSTGEKGELPGWLDKSYPAFLTGFLFFMLLLGFLGWRWSYGWRRGAMPSSLALFWIPLPYILSHADALSGARLPLDGVLLCYSA